MAWLRRRQLPGSPFSRTVALAVVAVLIASVIDAESTTYSVPDAFYNAIGAAVTAAATYAALKSRRNDNGKNGNGTDSDGE